MQITTPAHPVISPRDFGADLDDNDTCERLLAALVTCASNSKRRQADLTAALTRTKLNMTRERAISALALLEAAACVREIVPLYDGGVLVTVTNVGMDLSGNAACWHFLQVPAPLAERP